jgi:hypothetical protein
MHAALRMIQKNCRTHVAIVADIPLDNSTLRVPVENACRRALHSLERFSNFREVSGNVQGGFFLGKKPLRGRALPLYQLENRYSPGANAPSRPVRFMPKPGHNHSRLAQSKRQNFSLCLHDIHCYFS